MGPQESFVAPSVPPSIKAAPEDARFLDSLVSESGKARPRFLLAPLRTGSY